MFDVAVTNEQWEYAKKLVSEKNFGNRGIGDGTKKQQFVGVLGQTVFADLANEPRPVGDGFDGGKDFVFNGIRADIKTMTRKVPVRNDYVHNFVGYQKDYEVDFYIFASFNTENRIMTICGYCPKDLFFEKAVFFPKGSVRERSDGTKFNTFAPLYEIKQSCLLQMDSVEELIEDIASIEVWERWKNNVTNDRRRNISQLA